MSKNIRIAIAGLLFVASSGVPSRACTDPPERTRLKSFVFNEGPPVTVTIIFDPWTTFAADPTMSCASGFRFPTALIDTVDDVRFVETGTNTPIPGFSWVANSTTSAAVEGELGAGAGNEWFGFLTDISEDVDAGIEADFQVDVTLKPTVTLREVLDVIGKDWLNRVFTDEGNSDGTLTGNHPGFVDVRILGRCCYDSDGDLHHDACVDNLTVKECRAIDALAWFDPLASCSGVIAGCCLDWDFDGHKDLCVDMDVDCCKAQGGTVTDLCSGKISGCCIDWDQDGHLDTCLDIDRTCCKAQGGVVQDGPCKGPEGACCLDWDGDGVLGDLCVVMIRDCCVAQGGAFVGAGSVCLGDVAPEDGIDDACETLHQVWDFVWSEGGRMDWGPGYWTVDGVEICQTFPNGVVTNWSHDWDHIYCPGWPNDWHWYVYFEWNGLPAKVWVWFEKFLPEVQLSVEIFCSAEHLEYNLAVHVGTDMYALTDTTDTVECISGFCVGGPRDGEACTTDADCPFHQASWSGYPGNLPSGFVTTKGSRANFEMQESPGIPAVSEWGVVLMVVLVLTVGTMAIRGRRARVSGR